MNAWLGWAAFAVLVFALWAMLGLIFWIGGNALIRFAFRIAMLRQARRIARHG